VDQEASIGAIQKLPTTGVRGVICTDLLSTMMAESGKNHTKKLCWLLGYVGITGNKEMDEVAKGALVESIPNEGKYPPEDSNR
jgi:hypothetical protein